MSGAALAGCAIIAVAGAMAGLWAFNAHARARRLSWAKVSFAGFVGNVVLVAWIVVAAIVGGAP